MIIVFINHKNMNLYKMKYKRNTKEFHGRIW